jgi:acetyl-CoA carboxylase alpha subunit
VNNNLTPHQRVSIERSIARPHIEDFIEHLFSDFFEQKVIIFLMKTRAYSAELPVLTAVP